MCGLAGYNCSVERASQFKEDTATDLMHIGMIYNQHRGEHATGVMMSYMPEMLSDTNDGTFYYGKEPLKAEEFLKIHPLCPGKPVAMAIHTRDATIGKPSDNDNNHPVHYNGVFVTHNGTIKNESPFRNLVPTADRNKLPLVDSIVIPIYLSRIPNPLEDLEGMDWLIGGLTNMMGRYTFHAMYDDIPGLSLLVAGPDRPMWYIYKPTDNIHVYSSERRGAEALWTTLGYNDFKGCIQGELKEGTAILLHAGKIVRRWEFDLPPTSGWIYELKDKVTQQRIGFDGTVIETDENVGHWIRGTKPHSFHNAVEQEDAVLDLIGGVNANEADFDEDSRQKVLKVNKLLWAFEADLLYVTYPKWAQKQSLNWDSDTVRLFALYGNCEIVLSGKGSILDVYNTNITHEGYPWHEMTQPQNPPARVITTAVRTWLNQRLHKTGVVAKRQADAKKAKEEVTTVRSLPYSEYPQLPLRRHSIYQELGICHPTVADFVFLDDEKCTLHHLNFTQHQFPQNCSLAASSAWEYLQTMTSLFDINVTYEDVTLSVKGELFCPATQNLHDWTPKSYRKIEVETEIEPNVFVEQEFTFLIGEKCKRCTATRYWTNPVDFGFEVLPDPVSAQI